VMRTSGKRPVMRLRGPLRLGGLILPPCQTHNLAFWLPFPFDTYIVLYNHVLVKTQKYERCLRWRDVPTA
jgi:hypothetical protein